MLRLHVQDSAGRPIVGVVASLTRKGNAADFVVTLRSGERARHVPVRLAHEVGGCHVDKVSGPTIVTF